jgi:uridine kinase
MMVKRPCLIGIAGPSGAGKSTLARKLADMLPGEVSILALDSYYRDLSDLSPEQRAAANFDAPEAIEWPLLVAHLRALTAARAISCPVYNFALHTRAVDTQTVHPGDYVLVEGLLALHNQEVRRLLDVSIYVEAPDAVCFERRVERDVAERGRTRESVIRQYRETVLPMARRYVQPQKEVADIVVLGNEPLGTATARVLESIQR